jgi:hypothetical protein
LLHVIGVELDVEYPVKDNGPLESNYLNKILL